MDNYSEKYYSESPFNYCLNNPMLFIDPTGDTTYYYNRNGEFMGVTFDQLENGVSIVNNVKAFEKNAIKRSQALVNGEIKGYNTEEDGVIASVDDYAQQQRGLGDTYMVNDMWGFYENNKNDPSKEQPGLLNEHGTEMYRNSDGEIRTGKENYQGDWRITSFGEHNQGGEGPKETNSKWVSRSHLHPNVGYITPQGVSQPYPSGSFKTGDWFGAPNGQYFNAVISRYEICLYKRGENAEQITIRVARSHFRPLK